MNPTTRTETHVLIGPLDQVVNVLRRADSTGRLVHIGPAYPAANGKVRVTVDLLPHHRPQPRSRRRRARSAAITLAVGATLGVLALLGWLVYLAVTFIAAHIAPILGVLTLIVGAVVFLGRAGVCPGIHCPGCRHR